MSHYTKQHTETIEGFEIVFSTAYETTHPRDHFMSEDVQEYLEGIDSGKYEWFVARVQAFKNGIELGTDYLGGCLYESSMQFVKDNDYYNDMVQSAIKEAKANIQALTV
jgi:hypothetical protein